MLLLIKLRLHSLTHQHILLLVMNTPIGNEESEDWNR